MTSLSTTEPMAAAPAPAHGRATWRSRCELGLVGLAIAAVILFYAWTVSANSGFENWGNLDYYRLLVRGWMKGQLHMDIAPAPELLALADPYDPHQNGPYKLGDASLYRGRYYVYFGAAPALTLMFPYALLTDREMTMGTAVFIFASAGFLAASVLWLAIRRRYFPRSGIFLAPLGVLGLGFGTHLLALAQRPMIWELPIGAGVAFTTSAALAAYVAMHGRRPYLAMTIAGLCVGLAVGSRPTCLFAAGVLLPPVWLAWRRNDRRLAWRMAFAAAIPVALCGLAIMAHNYARFESPTEWGQNYQLSGAYEGKLTHFSIRFFLHNFAVYMFQPLKWTAEFPFALSEGIEINHIPGYFGTEEVSGLAVTFPFVWGILGLPLVWLRRNADETRTLNASLACVAAYALPVMTLVMCYFSTTTRYQTDFAVAFGILALVGLLGIERWAQQRSPRVRRGFVAVASVILVATIAVGVLASFDYHGRSLRFTSPGHWHQLEQTTHGWLAKVGHAFGQFAGPRVLKVRFQQKPVGTVETLWQSSDEQSRERILVEHIGERLIRFGFARGDQPATFGRDLRWDLNHTHTVTLQLPSLYPPVPSGWWQGAQRTVEFKQRSSVVVWFSGGRALELLVPPLPAQAVPGGSLAKDFSGEVRKNTSRFYLPDEMESGLTEPHAPRGGFLRMHVVFADPLHPKGEPLFAAGAHYRSSIVFVEPAEGGIRFVFENYSLPRVHSPVFKPRPEGHVVELQMASFRPEAYGVEATGPVIVRLDGVEVMRSTQVAYPFPWGDERIGFNPFGTTCSTTFRGWIRPARWVRGSLD